MSSLPSRGINLGYQSLPEASGMGTFLRIWHYHLMHRIRTDLDYPCHPATVQWKRRWLLHAVGEIPHISDICSLYWENKWKNMRYCVLSPIVRKAWTCHESLAKSSRLVSMMHQNKEENYLGTYKLKGKITV